MPNPWVLLGGILAILGAFAVGYIKGGKDCEAAYIAVALEEQTEAIAKAEVRAAADQLADRDSLRQEASIEQKHASIAEEIDHADLTQPVVADCPDPTIGPEFWRLFRAAGGTNSDPAPAADSSDGALP